MKYKTKPVEIEAIQWDGKNREEIFDFVGKELEVNLESETAYVAGQGAPIFSLTIPTLEGDHKAMQGDFIIRGLKGEYYPCKPDIFEMKYKPVKEELNELESK